MPPAPTRPGNRASRYGVSWRNAANLVRRRLQYTGSRSAEEAAEVVRNHEGGTRNRRVAPAVPKGATPGVDARRITGCEAPSERISEEGPVFDRRAASAVRLVDFSEGGGEEPSPRIRNRATGGRGAATARAGLPGPGESPEVALEATRFAGQPAGSARRRDRALRTAVAASRQLAAGGSESPSESGTKPQSAGARSRGRRRREHRGERRPRSPVVEASLGQPGDRDGRRDWTRPSRAGASEEVHEGTSRVAAVFSARDARARPRSGEPPSASGKPQGGGGSGKAHEPRTDRVSSGGIGHPWPTAARVP